VETVFNYMIQLQKLDNHIHEVSLFLESIPSQISSIDSEIKESEQIVEKAKNKLEQNQQKRRDLESNVQSLKDKLAKYKSQLNMVRTNIEYRSLLKEIDDGQVMIDSREEDIINAMMAADKLEEIIQDACLEAAKTKDALAKKKDDLNGSKDIQEQEMAKLLQQRKELLPGIPSDSINIYSKLAKKLEGIALSPVTDEFCAMCYMRIRPQMLNEIKTKSKIILCENCGRILYFEEGDETDQSA